MSGVLLIPGLGTRMSDPYVYVVFWALGSYLIVKYLDPWGKI